jgi:hypothetical protein
MARIWRDGQKRSCHIYRLLVTGLIDEKIFQRQLFKGNLSDVVGSGSKETGTRRKSKENNSGSFSREELRKLFSVNEGTDCDTRDTMAAGDAGCDVAWNDVKETTDDVVLQAAVQGASVSYAWLQAVKGQSPEDDGNRALQAGADTLSAEQPVSVFSDDEENVEQKDGDIEISLIDDDDDDDEFELDIVDDFRENASNALTLNEATEAEVVEDLEDANTDTARAVGVIDDEGDNVCSGSAEELRVPLPAVQKVVIDWDDVELNSQLN